MCKAAMKAFDEGSELATLQNGTDSGSGNARTAVAAIPSFFALCLAVKDDLDIVEWIEYHWRKGFSNPPLSHLIRQYIDKEIVEYIYCGSRLLKCIYKTKHRR